METLPGGQRDDNSWSLCMEAMPRENDYKVSSVSSGEMPINIAK